MRGAVAGGAEVDGVAACAAALDGAVAGGTDPGGAVGGGAVAGVTAAGGEGTTGVTSAAYTTFGVRQCPSSGQVSRLRQLQVFTLFGVGFNILLL